MAKIDRKIQKVFGGNLTANENIAVYGSLKVNEPTYSTEIDVIQSKTDPVDGQSLWEKGLRGSLVANEAPTLQDLNAIFYVLSKQLAYIFQSGIPEYSVTQTYYINSLCRSSGAIYRSILDDNLNNALTNKLAWVLITPVQQTISTVYVGITTQTVAASGYSVLRAKATYYEEGSTKRLRFSVVVNVTVKTSEIYIGFSGVEFVVDQAVAVYCEPEKGDAKTVYSASGGNVAYAVKVRCSYASTTAALGYVSISGDCEISTKPMWVS